MLTNEGQVDRAVRMFLGIAILSLFFYGPRSTWALLGFLPLLTGAFGWCPLYELVGISTCPRTAGPRDH
jgi:hypothetical protein